MAIDSKTLAIEYKNLADGEYELIVHGQIGEEVSGASIAEAIAYLNRCGAKKIKERINSIGGTIIDSFSIVTANIASEAIIETVNEGVADSCGSWLLATGNKGHRKAMDFASSLLHNPSINGVSLDDLPDGDTKNQLIIFRDSIARIAANNTGQSEEFIKDLMKQNRRLTAKELKEYGFIDEIISSEQKPIITQNMSALEIMNVCKASNSSTQNQENSMKSITKYLNLNEAATEDAVVQEIAKREDGLKADIQAAKNASEEAAKKNIQLEADLKAANDKLAAIETAAVETAVNAAIESGKFAQDQKENLIAKAKNMGLDNFNFMVSAIAPAAVNLAGQITNRTPEAGSDESKLAEEYEKAYKAGSLEQLKNANPTKYDQMEKAWIKLGK